MTREREPVIECQACGVVLQRLTDAQAQAVARNPHNYIGFCEPCKRAGAHIEPAYR